jgi:hypothetical protein
MPDGYTKMWGRVRTRSNRGQNLYATFEQAAEKSKSRSPRGLKPARDDKKHKDLEAGLEGQLYPLSFAWSFSAACEAAPLKTSTELFHEFGDGTPESG